MSEQSSVSGCVDTYGYCSATGSWLLCGWAPPLSGEAACGICVITLRFQSGAVVGEGLVATMLRGDLGTLGHGVVIHLPASREEPGRLVSAEIGRAGCSVEMLTTPDLTHVDDEPLLEVLKNQSLAPGSAESGQIGMILRRTPFEGEDTIGRFADRFALQIDEAIRCGPSDLLLNGWLIEAPPGIAWMRLRSGRRSVSVPVRGAVRVARPDVVAKYGEGLRSRAVDCGFIAALSDCIDGQEPAYIQIELASGEAGYLAVRPSGLRGLPAIRKTLASLTPRYDEVPRTFDLIGPALGWLNRQRLAGRRPMRDVRFGTPPAAPEASVIVPLYGRLDYMEVQVALMAQGGFGARHEMIYVVDDPSGADAALHLADSLHRRFGMPLRLLLPEENAGFAPACNAGLGIARGAHVCFLNSDVFALRIDWLDRLIGTLRTHPSIGIVGPVLLFEDGTIQHQGMGYDPLPEFGGWLFPSHPGKGSWPTPGPALTVHPSITGACMVLSRELARELGGFDERYVIGDFEDSDLCLRARRRGLVSAVDHAVSLTHLERKSQASGAEPWRLNVTLYNAWQHQAAWAAELDAEREAALRHQGELAAAP